MAEEPVAPGEREAPRAAAWFSPNPDKAWVERFYLAYSPFWMLSMGLMVVTGWGASFGNVALLVQAFGTLAPAIVIPAVLARKRSPGVPWHRQYWGKATIYLGIYSFFSSYFGTEYFFDLLGMVYAFPNATTTLDASLVGTGEQVVPLIMYPYAWFYFITYHVTAGMVLRRVRALGWKPGWLVFGVAVFVVGYFWAWAETKAMANPLMEDLFTYDKLDVMLRYGSAIYAIYFLVSFPFWFFLDEDREQPWDWTKIAGAAFTASMLMVFGLDIASHLVGTI